MDTTAGDRVFSFDVSISTHALLKQGVTAAWWTRVTVAAHCRDCAADIAAAMAARHGMPTGTYDRI